MIFNPFVILSESKNLQKEKEYEKTKGNNLLRNKVTEEEIAKIVSRWTGIPVSKLGESDKEKLAHLADILHKRVVGQDEAVEKVSNAILGQERELLIQTGQ